MSQDVFNSIDPDLVGGVELATILNNFKEALMSGLSGPTRPAEMDAGGTWIDTSTAGQLKFKLFTGTADATVFTVNLTTSSISIQGSDDFFEVVKTSDDAVGPQLSLVKNRSTTNTKSGDVVGVLNYSGKDDLGSRKVIGRIRYIAGGDVTSTNLGGGYFVIEAARSGAGAISEMLRVVDGRLAIGVTNPTHTIHTRGVGARHERVADDAVGVRVTRAKERIANNGQSITGDEISSDEAVSKSDAGVEVIVAKDIVTATENHTATARGIKREIQTVSKGSNSLVTRVKFEDGVIDTYGRLAIAGMERKVVLFPSVTEELALDATSSFIEVTGTTAMLLKGIKATSVSQSFYLYNSTNQNITIINQSPDAVADNRIAVNGETSFVLQTGKSVEFVRRGTTNRWSPLVEGHTGITYNEALELTAKQAMAEVDRFIIQPDLLTSPQPVAAFSSHVAVSGKEEFVALLSEMTKMTFIWGSDLPDIRKAGDSLNEGMGGTAWNGVSGWADVNVFGNRSAIAVRDNGTSRSLLFNGSLSTGTTTKYTDMDQTSGWKDITFAANNATDTGIFVAVAATGPTRIHRHGYAGMPYGAPARYVKTSAEITTPLYAVSADGDKFMAVGGPTPSSGTQGGAYLSTDAGVTWVAKTLPNQLTTTFLKVRFLLGKWYVIGNSSGNTVLLSSADDGTTWATVYTAPAGLVLKDISYCGGVFVLTASQSGKLRYVMSFDSIYWFVTALEPMTDASNIVSASTFRNRIHILASTIPYRSGALSFT